MKVAIIGRSEILYETTQLLEKQGHEVSLIITSKEAPEYTKTSKDFEKLAKLLGVPFIHTANIIEAIGLIQSCGNIDIGVSINYTGIIPKTVTDLFPLGILNAHGGDLPRYRGNACQAWAILNAEEKIGLCIHRMVGDELDSGNIIIRDFFPIDLNTKITSVYRWFNERVPSLFLDALQQLQLNPANILDVQSEDPKDTLRCYPRKPEDGRIDWNKSAEDVLRLINASNKPYTGAFCEYEGKKLIIWDAELAPKENFLAMPGQVTKINEKFVELATGKDKIRICQIEIDGLLLAPDKAIKSLRCRFY